MCPWARFDDEFPDHPKVLAAGPLAGWLHVCAICYACRYLTDGFIPEGQIRRLADVDEPSLLVGRLVSAGLWEVVRGGYQIHDFLAYQPSKAGIEHERAEQKRRTAEWRERQEARRNGVRDDIRDDVREAVGDAVTRGVRDGIRTGAPARPGPARLIPDPDPAGTSPQPPSARGGGRDPFDSQARSGQRLTEPTDADRELWAQAVEHARPDLNDANFATFSALEPAGRDEHGALCLRAPPEQGDVSRFRALVRRALVDAGDLYGGHAVILSTTLGTTGRS